MRTAAFGKIIVGGSVAVSVFFSAMPAQAADPNPNIPRTRAAQDADMVLGMLADERRVNVLVAQYAGETMAKIRRNDPDFPATTIHSAAMRNIGSLDQLIAKIDLIQKYGGTLAILPAQDLGAIGKILTRNRDYWEYQLGIAKDAGRRAAAAGLAIRFEQALAAVNDAARTGTGPEEAGRLPKGTAARPARSSWDLQLGARQKEIDSIMPKAIQGALANQNTQPGIATGIFHPAPWEMRPGVIYEPFPTINTNAFAPKTGIYAPAAPGLLRLK